MESAVAAKSECGSDDEPRKRNARKETLAAAWGRALDRLRGRGGGMTRQERGEQARLAKKEQSKERCALRAVGARGQDSAVHSDTRVLFTCDMLLKKERKRDEATRSCEWIGMTCDDPDDFESLRERRWSTAAEFKADEHVVVRRKDASAPPDRQLGYVRSGKAVKVILGEQLVPITCAKFHSWQKKIKEARVIRGIIEYVGN